MSAIRIRRDPTTGTEIRVARARCGLRILAHERPELRTKAAVLAVAFGSLDLRFTAAGAKRATRVPPGTAHFLEHKMFEKPEGDLFEAFAAAGASANAATTHDMTGYLFSCTENFEGNLDLLLRTVGEPHFTEELVEKERGIIAQEIRGYDDSAGWRAWRETLGGLYSKHPARFDIAGAVSDLDDITARTLSRCHEAFYVPRNMTLAIAGSVDLEEAVALVDERWPAVLAKRPIAERPALLEGERVARREARLPMPVSMPRLSLGYKGPTRLLKGREALELEGAVELFLEVTAGASTAFAEELYGSGLVGDDFGCSHQIEPRMAYAIAGAQSPDPVALREKLIKLFDEALDRPLDAEALERAKRRQTGSHVRGWDDPDGTAWLLAENELANEPILAWPELLAGLGERRIRKLAAQLFRPERACSVLVEPTGAAVGAGHGG